MWSALQSFWERVRPIDCEAMACGGFRDLEQLPIEIRQRVCDSYPPNHNFSVDGTRLIPSRKLAARVSHFRRFYPHAVRNLLDLSCSKGFFVFDAAREISCERAVGIDLCDATLEICRQLGQHFDRSERIGFEKFSLAEFARRVTEFGGPFETVLLVNTYQYLFFGSSIAPALSHDHCEIFRQIREVCEGRVIFHNRVTWGRVQKHVRETPEGREWCRYYTADAIRSAASEFFRVTEMPVWGGHPVWLMDAL